ncbi:hypothetical protein BV378_10545 [Nostoc sp. RF31YmG]|nr:hypothetical protein BV375_32340 [Nostoc sp. 106C]OUL27104.1 hypothetical protein BV378_10545 [Nostoc sp. RF31YmG]
MMKNSTNFIGSILILAAMALSAVPFVKPKIFKRQDVLLIIGFLIAGINLLLQGKYLDELPQFSLVLLAISALFYTVESFRLRLRNPK